MPEDGFNRLKDTRHGRMLYNINDQYVGRSLDLYGEFSEGEIELFQKLVQSGDIVLDVGANIGAHTVWFAKRVGLRGTVIAFEPQRFVFQLLCANLALNDIINTIAFWQAVGESPATLTVPLLDPNASNNFGGLELGMHQQGDRVGIVRLDDAPLPRCTLIKVDVEGMELAVLKGATQLIRRFQPVLYVENDRPHLSADLTRFIHGTLNYDLYWHCPVLFNPNNFFGNAQNVFGNIGSLNMLCVPRGRQVLGLRPVEIPAA